MDTVFQPYPKTPRLFRDIVITEKLDGTNAQIVVDPIGEIPSDYAGLVAGGDYCEEGDFAIRAGSRNRWITPLDDNYGFARWVFENREELVKLGPGRHFGEWWGSGIQRNYGLKEKRFSLFNVNRWTSNPDAVTQKQLLAPACCSVVPTLYSGPFDTRQIQAVLEVLAIEGSAAAPGFMEPEGIVVFHTAASRTFKVLLENDADPKGTE